MSEEPDKSPERFQFSLRTLLLVVTACAVMLSGIRMGEATGVFSVLSFFAMLAPIVALWVQGETTVTDALLLVYIVATALFLASVHLVGV